MSIAENILHETKTKKFDISPDSPLFVANVEKTVNPGEEVDVYLFAPILSGRLHLRLNYESLGTSTTSLVTMRVYCNGSQVGVASGSLAESRTGELNLAVDALKQYQIKVSRSSGGNIPVQIKSISFRGSILDIAESYINGGEM